LNNIMHFYKLMLLEIGREISVGPIRKREATPGAIRLLDRSGVGGAQSGKTATTEIPGLAANS